MNAIDHLCFVLCLLLAALLVRWFAISICSGWLRVWVRGHWGNENDTPGFARLFRQLGWQLSNAAWGLAVSAWIVSESHLHKISSIETCHVDLQLIIPSVCFLILLLLYGLAAQCRYILLEAAEKARGIWHRCLSACLLGLLGILILLYALWLLIGW